MAEPGLTPFGADDDDDDGGAPAWVTTFADLMSLLLTFFILLLSFSVMDNQKFFEISGSMEKAFGVQKAKPVVDTPRGENIIFKEFVGHKGHGSLVAKLNESVSVSENKRSASKGKVDIEVFEDYRGVVMRVGDGNMFEAGRADVKPSVWPFLDDVIAAIEDDDVDIAVEAHTDNRPIKSKQFASNWHLSALRSVAVVEYMRQIGKLQPARLSAIGRGDAVPIVPNTTKRNRARNRRVEFVFSKHIKANVP